MTPGQVMKNLRKSQGFSQQYVADEVAKILGEDGLKFSQETYSRIERDKTTNFSLVTVSAIARVLNTTPDKLFPSIIKTSNDIDVIASLPPTLREWIKSKEALTYIAEAYVKFQKDKVMFELKEIEDTTAPNKEKTLAIWEEEK